MIAALLLGLAAAPQAAPPSDDGRGASGEDVGGLGDRH